MIDCAYFYTEGLIDDMLTTTEIAFFGFILLIILSFRRVKGNVNDVPTLDHKSSEQLKGLAIILVVFGHLCSGFINLPSLKYSGAQGVSIFLIISGFGLTKSYFKKGIDGSFFIRRFKTVLLPYMIVTTIVIALDFLTNTHSISSSIILSSLFGLNMQVDPTMWYISFIFLWYLVFYVVFGLNVRVHWKILCLMITSMLIKLNIPSGFSLLNTPYEYSLHAFAFPLGVILALYSEKICSFFRTKTMLIWSLFTLGIALLVGFLLSFRYISFEHQTIYTVINLMLAFSLIIIVTLLNYLRIESKLLIILGKYSFEIYLLEALFFTRFNLLMEFNNKWVALLVYLSVTLVTAFILNKLIKLILNLLEKPKVRQNIHFEL